MRYLTKVFFLSAIILAFNVTRAQQSKKIDSLLIIVKTAKEDTNTVNTLITLSRQFLIANQYPDVIKYANQAVSLSEKLGYKKGIARSYNNIGNAYSNQGNYAEAMKNYLASLKIRQEISDKPGIIYSYNNIGVIYTKKGNYAEGLKNFLAALKIQEEIGDKQGLPASYNNIGIIYKSQGNYTEAQKNYQAALKIQGELGDKGGIAYSYINIGNVYVDQGNYAEALENFLAALKIIETTGDKKGIIYSYNNIGIVYNRLGNYAEALKNYQAALKIEQEIGDKDGMAYSYNNMGVLYGAQRNYTEALKNYQAALKIREEIGSKNGIAYGYHNIGTIYYNQGNYAEALKNLLAAYKIQEEIGDKTGMALFSINLGDAYLKSNRYAEAKKFLDTGLTLAKKIGNKNEIEHAYYSLATLDSSLGNYKGALAYYRLSIVYKDSLFNEANSKQIAQMKEQYESEKKDKEILKLEGEKQKLEDDKRLTALLIKTKEDSLSLVRSEKDKIRLDNERIQAINLYNQQQIILLAKDKQLQQLRFEKNQADLIAQKAETDKKQSDYLAQKTETEKKSSELSLANNISQLQALEIANQKQVKNYMIAGLALLLVLSFFMYRSYHIKQQLRLQTLRNKIASDLHDDVGSTLSSISIFSEMAKQQSKEVLPLLDTIGESSRKMLDAMGDIVWTINPENDQFEKIVSRMKGFAYELLGAKGIDFEFTSDEEITRMKLPMDVRKNLYLIFKEATNNMVKYSNADKAMFAIKGGKDNLTMIIKDNGKGFDITQSSEGNGLKNMRRRAGEIGAAINIESNPGKGTSIELRIAV